jgi:hypothetical protein
VAVLKQRRHLAEEEGEQKRVIDLCDFFNKLWMKVIDREELDHMQMDIARILSSLEMFLR